MKRMMLTALLAAALPLALGATTLTFDLTGSNSNGSIGNSRTYSDNGVIVTVTAWGLTGNGLSTLAPGALGQWGSGLGVCNAAEGAGCGSPQHQVDNRGQFDFVMFQFSEEVELSGITINPYGYYDTDVTYWAGTIDLGTSLSGLTLPGLAGILSGPTHNLANVPGAARTVTLDTGSVNTLVFGATTKIGHTGNDYFKITSLTGELHIPPPPPNEVPEPSTYALLSLGLIGIGMRKRLLRG